MNPSKASHLSTANRILLVGDESDAVSETQALIKDINGKLTTISDPDQIVTTFDDIEPQVLLLVSMDVGKAERYYLNLYRNSHKIQTTVHNTLLVCKAKDAEIAYQLCLRKVFDDYVVIRPLFDPFRLTISIRNMLAAQKTLDISSELQQRMVGIRNSTAAKDRIIQQALTQGTRVSAQLVQSEEQLNQLIEKKIQAIAEHMSSYAFDGVIQVIDQAALSEKLSHFGHKILAGEISGAIKKPQIALNELLKDSRTSYDAQSQVSSDLNAWLNSIPPRILIVDDDPIILMALSSMLSNEGFEVLSAANATEGLRAATQFRPTLILLDYEMPEMTGLDFIAKAKALPHLCQIPIIMLTGHTERSVVQQTITAGVSDYMVKSSPKEVILQKLRLHIGFDRNTAKNSALQK